MKNFYLLILLLYTSVAALAQSNHVIVSGTVKTTTGLPVPNRLVYIAADTTLFNNSCWQTHTTYTNANGYYADTISCNTSITKLKVKTANCNGTVLINEHIVPTTGIVTSNFVTCAPPPTTCVSSFNFHRAPASFTVNYNSGASTAATATDSIIRRKWRFGDGHTLNGNIVSPTHTYVQRGYYQVCLTIFTAAGCEKTVCNYININDSTTAATCRADFSPSPSASNNRLIKFTSTALHTTGDSIVSRTWRFGDGDTLGGNIANPEHLYTNNGIYNVCLRIKTASGCVAEKCKLVEIRSTNCVSRFGYVGLPISSTTSGFPIKFNSSIATTAAPDSIRERIWKFGDGTTLSGNTIEPIKVYSVAGTYQVALIIRTNSGCSDTANMTIHVPLQNQQYCQPSFNFTPSANNVVQFNSSASATMAGDSIVTRIWNFGDGSTLVTGNVVNPQHAYSVAGIYTVCLRTITARGCERSICKQIITHSPTTASCIARFNYRRTGPRQASFNSVMSWTPIGDSIIERTWDFGDGSARVTGNVVNPVKDYLHQGIYTVCLKIKTTSGCVVRYCMPVRVQDSVTTTTPQPIVIVNMFPNPAVSDLNTVVWSLYNNINAEVAVHDIYGTKKWSTQKVLLQGNNMTAIPVATLPTGSYFLKVTTMYGVQSRRFYKL